MIKYVKDHTADYDKLPIPYWANTSGNEIVRHIIDRAGDIEKEEIQTLIEGGTIDKYIRADVTYGEIDDSTDSLWNFLFYTGYLTPIAEKRKENESRSTFTLKIPNQEVLYAYETVISVWFEQTVKSTDFSALHKAVINGDTEGIKNEINIFLMDTISYNDYAESFYHGVMTGLLSGIKGYSASSNKESGTGRPDLVVMEKTRKTAFIFEFKHGKNSDIDVMDQKCREALQQIEEKNYEHAYRRSGYEKIVKYGIAFSGKGCRVMKAE